MLTNGVLISQENIDGLAGIDPDNILMTDTEWGGDSKTYLATQDCIATGMKANSTRFYLKNSGGTDVDILLYPTTNTATFFMLILKKGQTLRYPYCSIRIFGLKK